MLKWLRCEFWCRKVEQIAEEADSLRQSLDKYNIKNQKQITEAKERAKLLGLANGDSSHVLRIFDEEAQAIQSLGLSVLEKLKWDGLEFLNKIGSQSQNIAENIYIQFGLALPGSTDDKDQRSDKDNTRNNDKTSDQPAIAVIQSSLPENGLLLDEKKAEEMRALFSTAESAVEAWAMMTTSLGHPSYIKSEFEKYVS
ncbi:hypothetical protein Ahy_B10g104844 [Arachis hypogaea]|uniref:Uncharacterized protein n=1 Tax=Arachis hypogaea TaxID=3818 RepID=A0A444X6J4_ARAHY|nr:hypothetical protein Ahy_B10g104844 [Arachis hypogaea]